MYKVVIIDDEPIIVEGLTKSIHWDRKGCIVVGTAYSGETGLMLIQKEQPDIVISDIRMPRMDGLTMIASVKSQYPDTQITILTGFRDFDYAQKAIRLGVSRFLLKPSRMDEIEEALNSMLFRLDELHTGFKRSHIRLNVETNELEKVPKEELEEDAGEIVYDSAASSFIVKNAMAYIEQNYTEKLKLVDVADQVYVSQWHLSKLLNRHTGQNFSEILNGIRIEKAKELLKDPALRIGDIAEAVGFLDMAHFSRVFKKQVGISANEYRNTLPGK